ncbi:3,4-dihydroxy-2-butanone-4-phosphate synthase [Myxococcota bacterium]|nr:3,4-dihydroxy-2-butanone-4-phosphate synthase [Myxococcota bacterium]
MTDSRFDSIKDAISDLQQGKMIIVVDDEDRENEGDFVIAAQHITPEHIVMMNRLASGIITVPVPHNRLMDLNIGVMVSDNSEAMSTAFTITVDAKKDISTGSSAQDRSVTIRKLADPASTHRDFVRPGHINPLMVREGGVLRRAGHTEAASDLMRLGGLEPVGVLCEIMGDNGEMLRFDELFEMSRTLDMKFISIADLIRYRRKTEKLVTLTSRNELKTRYGTFTACHYASKVDASVYTALIRGDIANAKNTLVRIHSANPTNDLLARLQEVGQCPLEMAMERLSKEDHGVLLYIEKAPMDQSGIPMDERDFGIGAQILADLGVHRVTLLTDHPVKRSAIEGFGIHIDEYLPLEGALTGAKVLRFTE